MTSYMKKSMLRMFSTKLEKWLMLNTLLDFSLYLHGNYLRRTVEIYMHKF